MGIQTEKFGVTKEGAVVTKYILENKNGLKLVLSDLGAVILALYLPDRDGVLEDVSLGFDQVSDYEVNAPAFGAVIGRVANRISGAGFTLNGKKYDLDDNDKSNCLHSGFDRYEHKMYEAECDTGEGQA
ncbi:MAG: galactose-1-epimerase, partial [Lachnospiraceae bacterium]|nr:galactose-1-epimerase [Lachnospiraceae bacterium]